MLVKWGPGVSEESWTKCLTFPGRHFALKWRHDQRDGVSNHQPHDCLLNRLFRHRSKKTSKLRVTGFCEGNSPVTVEFPAQRATNAENDDIIMGIHFLPGIYGHLYSNISEFFAKVLIDYKSTLLKATDWCLTCVKPLPGPITLTTSCDAIWRH